MFAENLTVAHLVMNSVHLYGIGWFIVTLARARH